MAGMGHGTVRWAEYHRYDISTSKSVEVDSTSTRLESISRTHTPKSSHRSSQTTSSLFECMQSVFC